MYVGDIYYDTMTGNLLNYRGKDAGSNGYNFYKGSGQAVTTYPTHIVEKDFIRVASPGEEFLHPNGQLNLPNWW